MERVIHHSQKPIELTNCQKKMNLSLKPSCACGNPAGSVCTGCKHIYYCDRCLAEDESFHKIECRAQLCETSERFQKQISQNNGWSRFFKEHAALFSDWVGAVQESGNLSDTVATEKEQLLRDFVENESPTDNENMNHAVRVFNENLVTYTRKGFNYDASKSTQLNFLQRGLRNSFPSTFLTDHTRHYNPEIQYTDYENAYDDHIGVLLSISQSTENTFAESRKRSEQTACAIGQVLFGRSYNNVRTINH